MQKRYDKSENVKQKSELPVARPLMRVLRGLVSVSALVAGTACHHPNQIHIIDRQKEAGVVIEQEREVTTNIYREGDVIWSSGSETRHFEMRIRRITDTGVELDIYYMTDNGQLRITPEQTPILANFDGTIENAGRLSPGIIIKAERTQNSDETRIAVIECTSCQNM
ncbi:hypothetical protein KKF81_00515 [Candidatus Micrarchaeota archaeon]|nr:hypothetical protein [Candidatus Micrarchaeota archaeon]MBU1165401.1 hypothetical protein [Candidatus Micrarchaeota archaeon]MBU1886450.1 hypothetical protein [Candidatus Micrarchaeota archaeon]